jgi:hypothetical protein
MSYSRRQLYAMGEPLGESITHKSAGRIIYGGGGGGGGSSQPGMGDSKVDLPTSGGTGGVTVPPPAPYANMAVNTQQGYNTLQSMKGVPWEKAGTAYNDLLTQGFTSDQIRSASTDMYGKPSEANWTSMVQNAGMNSPTGRPVAGSDQFYQPIYKSQYQNYARPSTQFDVSTYGTQPMNSPAFNSGMSRGNINNTIENFYRTNPMGRDAPMSDTLNFMRDSGVNREDFQSWAGKNNYSPQVSTYKQPAQFNPYTNSSSYGGFGSFSGPMGNIGNVLSQVMPQMQNPYSPQQPQQQMPEIQSPFSHYQRMNQQPSYQQPSAMTPPPPRQPPVSQPNYQPNYGPSSLPQYVYDTIRDLNQYKSQPVPQRMSSGPSQAIIGRSSQMRGTPNVMRRAEGGITSLLDQDE